MPQPSDPTPSSKRLVALFRMAVATDEDSYLPALTYRLPVEVPRSEATFTYTVDLLPDAKGTFLVACRELPDLLTFGENEEDALAMAVLAIVDELIARRGTPPADEG